jgi:hypothetical protein
MAGGKFRSGNRMPSRQIEWAGIDALVHHGLKRERPEGSFTTAEYTARYKVSEGTAKNQLARLVKAGALTNGKFVSGGRISNWYLVKPEQSHVAGRNRRG